MNDLYLQGLRIDWDFLPRNSYVHNISAIKSISEMSFEKSITFFVGENGTDKSTLLEAIAVEFGYNAEGGTRNYNFSTYDDISPLSESITLGVQNSDTFLGQRHFSMLQLLLCFNIWVIITIQILMEKAILNF